ncbi:MAG: PepSY domain-containing protein, partial [Comamonas sp.]
HTPGKPVEAQLDSDWGKTSYKVKLLQADNVVTSVRLDAETGKVTGTKKD